MYQQKALNAFYGLIFGACTWFSLTSVYEYMLIVQFIFKYVLIGRDSF